MDKFIISITATIIDAIKALNNLSDSGLTLFVADDNEIIRGSVTDGDIRRQLIAGYALNAPITSVMNPKFKYLLTDDKDSVLKYKEFREKGITVIPVLDNEGKLISVINTQKTKSVLPIDAVLMAGGKGERLRPLTEKTPKPLLPVGNKAIIDHNIDRLISFGVKNISVTVNYLKEQLIEHFSEKRDNVKINCVTEPKFLGTMGSIQFVEKFHNDAILVMNSDLFTNINYEDFYLHFKENDADISVVAVPYTISIPYGILDLDGRNIKGLLEKPIYNHYANGGIYLIRKEMLGYIPKDAFFNATDLIEIAIANKKKVIRFPLNGTWIDIGNHQEYSKAKDLIKHL